jgi:hypothetical protein
MKKILVGIAMIILLAIACNAPAGSQVGSLVGGASPTEAGPGASPTQALVQPAGATAIQPLAGSQGAPVITETDPCKLLSAEKAALILGETPNVVPAEGGGISTCMFLTQKANKSILISFTSANVAKANFISEILQYQKGCSVSYSGGTSTATPLPPEGQALLSKSLPELFVMDLQLQAPCGGKSSPLPEYGSYAYSMETPVFPAVSVVIATEERLFTFTYAETGGDPAKLVENARAVAKAALGK